MEIEIGRGKKGRRAYGFDDVAIVPSRRTRDPDDIDISWTLGPYRFDLPLVASAMDGVVSPETAVLVHKLVCEGTVEERIAAIIDDKQRLADLVVGHGETWLSELSTADLHELVRLDTGDER